MTFDPASYWEARYARGEDSGAGSRGKHAETKARFLNDLIADHEIASMIDWGCGDGQVLSLLTDDVTYTGVDLSRTVIDRHQATWPQRTFVLNTGPASVAGLSADLAVSADVLHHFPDDPDYERYLATVFGSAGRFVAIWATDHDGGRTARHVRWRHWTPDVADRFPDWDLVVTQHANRRRKKIDPTEPAWYLYQHQDGS